MSKAQGIAQSANQGQFKNRLINSDMRIDQRNAGASVNSDNSFPVDRFKISISGSATASAQRSTTAPTGFVNSILYTVGTGATQGTSSVHRLFQVLEGFNTADLMWGTAQAQTVSLSFWARSSVVGTFSGSLIEINGGTASYTFNYVINNANTWEYKTVTIVGSTVGTWNTTNGASIAVVFDLGSGTNFEQSGGSWTTAGNKFRTAGSVVLTATSGATFYITGVQLEKGSTATSFDYRPYGTELALCQRYYEIGYFDGVGGFIAGAGVSVYNWLNFAVRKPGTPTMSAPANWTTQASAGGTTSRSFGTAGVAANGFNAQLGGSDPRAWGNWIASNEL